MPERIEGVKTTSTSSTRGYGSSSYNGNSNFYGGYSGTGSSSYNSNSSGTSISQIVRSGGYSVTDLSGNYTLDLIDVRTKTKIWTATIYANISGRFANWNRIYEKIASEAIIKMEEDGIIPEIKWNENYNDNEVKNTNTKLPKKKNTTSNSNQEPACDKDSFIYIMFGSC